MSRESNSENSDQPNRVEVEVTDHGCMLVGRGESEEGEPPNISVVVPVTAPPRSESTGDNQSCLPVV